METVQFTEATTRQLIVSDAHVHCFKTERRITSKMYQDTPRSHSGLIFVREGMHLFHTEDGTVLSVGPNELLYVPEQSKYYHYPAIGDLDKNGKPITHTHGYVADFMLRTPTQTPVVFGCVPLKLEKCHMYAEKFERMSYVYNANTAFQFGFLSRLYELLAEICEEYSKQRISPQKYAMIKPALVYLSAHNIADITVSRLAEVCYISENYFRKLFYEFYGMLPHAYITMKKLQQAAYLLENRSCTITEISNLLHFSTPSHFAAKFKAFYGCIPSQYKM